MVPVEIGRILKVKFELAGMDLVGKCLVHEGSGRYDLHALTLLRQRPSIELLRLQ